VGGTWDESSKGGNTIKETYDDAYVGKCLVIDVRKTRDEGAHRLDKESRLHANTSIIRSCTPQFHRVTDMSGSAEAR
jgi:hypothetical protein